MLLMWKTSNEIPIRKNRVWICCIIQEKRQFRKTCKPSNKKESHSDYQSRFHSTTIFTLRPKNCNKNWQNLEMASGLVDYGVLLKKLHRLYYTPHISSCNVFKLFPLIILRFHLRDTQYTVTAHLRTYTEIKYAWSRSVKRIGYI